MKLDRWMASAILSLLVLSLWAPHSSVRAQSDGAVLGLQLRRTFGYQAGARIQGRFTLDVISDQALVEVTYLIDDEIMAKVTQPSFRISFSTSEFPPGEHALQAVGILADGELIQSQVITAQFITAEEGWQEAGRVAGWILGGIVIIMLLGTLGVNLFTRGKDRFELGVYGSAGGAVCHRCALPFSRHVFSPNLLLGKLERCPHCGRVAIVPRASRSNLDAAEDRYREDRDRGQRMTPEDRERDFRKQLDDSRFEG